MTLNVVYYSAAPIRHASGRVYNPSAANLVTVPFTDASGLLGGGLLPGGLPPATIFPSQLLPSTNQGNPMFLYMTGATTDRPPTSVTTGSTSGQVPAPLFGTPYLDTTIGNNTFVFYTGPGFGSTNWFNPITGLFA